MLEAEIGTPGMEQMFEFRITEKGRYGFQTNGRTGSVDTLMALLDPNNKTTVISENDDLAAGNFNSRIIATLEPGVYYVKVRLYHSTQVGQYTASVQPEF